MATPSSESFDFKCAQTAHVQCMMHCLGVERPEVKGSFLMGQAGESFDPTILVQLATKLRFRFWD